MRSPILQHDKVSMYRNKFGQSEWAGTGRNEGPECIVFCKQGTPNHFEIRGGFAVVPKAADCFNDGVCMISNFTKVVFVFDQGKVGR